MKRALPWLLAAGLALGSLAFWFFGSPFGSVEENTSQAEAASADSASVELLDAGLALDADAGPPPPGPAVRAPSQRANSQASANADSLAAAVAAEAGAAAGQEADQGPTLEDPDRDNTPGALGEQDTQFARFVALMDTRYASFRQGAEDCVETLPPSLNARLEVRITRNDLGDPYEVNVTGADLPTEVVDCLTRKARAIELPEPFRVDPYESDDYDVDSQTDSEFDWVTRVQLGN